MAFCGKCGKELVTGAKFCQFCGASVEETEYGTPQSEPQGTKRAGKGINSADRKIYGIIAVILGGLLLFVVLTGVLVTVFRGRGAQPAFGSRESSAIAAEEKGLQDPLGLQGLDLKANGITDAYASEECEEMLGYIGADAMTIMRVFSNPRIRSGNVDIRYVEGNLAMRIKNGADEIYMIEIIKGTDYSMIGIVCGMPLKDAENLLEQRGFSCYSKEMENLRRYQHKEGIFIDLMVDSTEHRKVTRILAQMKEGEQEEIRELSDYLRMDITEFANEFGTVDQLEKGEFIAFSDEKMTAIAQTKDARIHLLEVKKDGDYTLFGLQPGMTMTDAESILNEKGCWQYLHDYHADEERYYRVTGNDTIILYGDWKKGKTIERVALIYGEVKVAERGDYLLPESDTRVMVDADLAPLTHEELCFARNEIYARHGWIFSIKEIAEFFSQKSWYKGTIPGVNFDNSVLNEIEKYNIQFITNYEALHYGGSYY